MTTGKSINKLSFFLSALMVTITLFGCSCFRNDPPLDFSEEKIKEIDKVVNTLYENGQFSGAVLVSIKGKVVYKNAVGYANLEDSIPNTCDTKFRIASFTKPFTAMLILQLVEEGKLLLDGKLTDYLPEFTLDGGDEITIHQLLTHTAGITGESRIPDLIDIEKMHYTRNGLLDRIMEYDLVYEPGRGREYSNFGYALLALVIENVTGKSYDEVMNENICKPAGMTNTLSDITEMPIENRAVGYTYDYFTGPEEASYLDMSFCLGAGQLLSTVEDLYLFDQALYTDKLLSKKSKELFFNKYGWHPARYPYGSGFKKISCYNLEGSINGFQSHTQRIEKDTVLIVALRNVKEAVYEKQIVIKWASSIASPVISTLYNEDYNLPKKSGAFVIFRKLIESGHEDAEKLHKKMTEGQTDRYYLNKREFKFFEEELIKKGMTEKATEYKNICKK